MGIPLRPGLADSSLQSLAREARAGNKPAQFELALRFESGRGVPVDVAKATELLRSASRRKGGVQMLYMPSGSGVRAVPVSTGPYVAGLADAERKLEEIRERSGNRHLTWFALKSDPQCAKVSERRLACLTPIHGPERLVISVQHIYETRAAVPDISGRLICDAICSYDSETFIVGGDLRLWRPRIAFVGNRGVTLGLVVQIEEKSGSSSARLYLTEAGSKLSLDQMRRVFSASNNVIIGK